MRIVRPVVLLLIAIVILPAFAFAGPRASRKRALEAEARKTFVVVEAELRSLTELLIATKLALQGTTTRRARDAIVIRVAAQIRSRAAALLFPIAALRPARRKHLTEPARELMSVGMDVAIWIDGRRPYWVMQHAIEPSWRLLDWICLDLGATPIIGDRYDSYKLGDTPEDERYRRTINHSRATDPIRRGDLMWLRNRQLRAIEPEDVEELGLGIGYALLTDVILESGETLIVLLDPARAGLSPTDVNPDATMDRGAR